MKKLSKRVLSLLMAVLVTLSSLSSLLFVNAVTLNQQIGTTTKIQNAGQRSISYSGYTTYFDAFKDANGSYMYCLEPQKGSPASNTVYTCDHVLTTSDLKNSSDESTPSVNYVFRLLKMARKSANKERYATLLNAGKFYTAVKICIQKYPVTSWGSSRTFSGTNLKIYECAVDLHNQAKNSMLSPDEEASIEYTQTAYGYISGSNYIFRKGTVSGNYDSYTASVTGDSAIKVTRPCNV